MSGRMEEKWGHKFSGIIIIVSSPSINSSAIGMIGIETEDWPAKNVICDGISS